MAEGTLLVSEVIHSCTEHHLSTSGKESMASNDLPLEIMFVHRDEKCLRIPPLPTQAVSCLTSIRAEFHLPFSLTYFIKQYRCVEEENTCY